MNFIPFMHKKLMKGFPTCSVSKQQLQLLFFISNKDGMPMTFYSERMMVSKPNITVMADKLIEEEYIERAFDPKDRRVVILNITEKGQRYIDEQRKKVVKEMAERLDVLNMDEVKRLNEIFEEMTSILHKIDS